MTRCLVVDDDAGVFVGFIANAADLGDDLLVGEFGDALHQLRTVHVEGNLSDDDLLAVLLHDADVDRALAADAAVDQPVSGAHVVAGGSVDAVADEIMNSFLDWEDE